MKIRSFFVSQKKPLTALGGILLLALITYSAYYTGLQRGKTQGSITYSVVGVKNHASDGKALSPGLTGSQPGKSVDFASFWQVWGALDQKFIPRSTSSADMVSKDTRVTAAIQGLVASYDDPYTVFFPPKQSAEFNEQVKGEFEGIGAVLNLVDNIPVVIRPLEDRPAARAGILEGDKILAVDGIPMVGLSLEEVVQHIRGPRDSEVTLTIIHPDESIEQDIVVTRGIIAIPSTAQALAERVEASVERAIERVKKIAGLSTAEPAERERAESIVEKIEEEQPDAQDFFVFGLANFSASSKDAFRKELTEFKESGTTNLVIDLRNNAGGYIGAAVEAASFFLPQGTVVVREKKGREFTETIYKSSGDTLLHDLEDVRIALLVNRNTASAAEILASALQEHGRAVVVGENTFGKGSVQELVTIADDTTLKVTVARWYTPHNHSLSGTGLTPDIVVDPAEEHYENSIDPVFERAIEALLSPEDS